MLSRFKLEWRYFLLAVGFFTRVPVPSFTNFKVEELNHSAKYFPLIGILVGAVGAGFYLLSARCLPQTLAVLISMASTIYLTGAFHEDGLADSADGMGGGWKREQILTIMLDSRLGTYGAIAIFLALFVKFELLSTLHHTLVAFALIMAHSLSRLSAVWIMATLPYTKMEGKAKPLATHINRTDLILANVMGVLPFFVFIGYQSVNHGFTQSLLNVVLLTLIPMLLVGVWWRRKINYWLNGYTGDTLGAMQQMTEIAFYFGLVLWSMNS